jgi:hypothetical protein
LEEEMARWMAVPAGEAVQPKEIASFLGKLVFASQVVKNGRTYMQGMLTQFKGAVVDWRRGMVKLTADSYGQLCVKPAFKRDLLWWRAHLRGQSLARGRVRKHSYA